MLRHLIGCLRGYFNSVKIVKYGKARKVYVNGKEIIYKYNSEATTDISPVTGLVIADMVRHTAQTTIFKQTGILFTQTYLNKVFSKVQ